LDADPVILNASLFRQLVSDLPAEIRHGDEFVSILQSIARGLLPFGVCA
jgi:hypothetical protein